MAMKPKRYSVWLALQNLKAVVKFSGMTRLGLVLAADCLRCVSRQETQHLMKQIKSQTTGVKL